MQRPQKVSVKAFLPKLAKFYHLHKRQKLLIRDNILLVILKKEIGHVSHHHGLLPPKSTRMDGQSITSHVHSLKNKNNARPNHSCIMAHR